METKKYIFELAWKQFIMEQSEFDYRGPLNKWQRYADEIERTLLQFKMKKQRLNDEVRAAVRDTQLAPMVFDPKATTPRKITDALLDMQRSVQQLQTQMDEWQRFMKQTML